ncbi:MAG: Zinc ribbon domain [Deltaproteobacteria bacterium]|nr:Zinc ribbon domain [Deltaproteobacteria bacterium]
MPIYEYLCNDCEKPFEELVMSAATAVACPLCEGTDIERLMSVVNARSGGRSGELPATACGRPSAPPGCDGHGGCGCH